MIDSTISHGARPVMVLELELGRGPQGASARVELLAGCGERPGRTARVALRGWIDRAAERRLERAFRDLAAHDVDHVVLDCRDVRHLDERAAHRLAAAAAHLGTGAGRVEVWGRPRRAGVRDGAPSRVAAGTLGGPVAGALEPSGDLAS